MIVMIRKNLKRKYVVKSMNLQRRNIGTIFTDYAALCKPVKRTANCAHSAVWGLLRNAEVMQKTVN